MTRRLLGTSAHFATLLALPVALCLALHPGEAAAADGEQPGMLEYGFKGFVTGAPIGLATGFLATGEEYKSEEWRTLVIGAGVGALIGTGVGVTLGFVDLETAPPGTGWLVLRGIGVGAFLGAAVGAAVGAIVLVKSEEPKDILTGASWGALIGSGVGIAFGLVEGAAAHRKAAPPAPTNLQEVKEPAVPVSPPPPSMSVGFSVVGAEGSLVPLPALVGTF